MMKKKTIKKKSIPRKPVKSISKSASPKPKSLGTQLSNSKNNKTGIFPLADRVLVKPLEAEELTKTSSGIIIPDTVSKEKPEQGEVMAVGIKATVKVGDRVVFSRYGFDEVKVKGVEYYILKEENILAIIK